MIRLALLLFLLGGSARAQETAVLGGWALPEGAVVESVMSVETVGTLRMMGDAVPYENGAVKRTVTTMEEVERGRLMRALQRITSSDAKTWLGGEPAPTDPDPLLGRDVVVVRVGDG